MEKIIGHFSKKEKIEFDKIVWGLHQIIRRRKLIPIFESGGRGVFSIKEDEEFIADIILRFNGDIIIKNSKSRDKLAREHIIVGEKFFRKLFFVYKRYKQKNKDKRYDSILKDLISAEEIELTPFIVKD